MLKAAKDGGWHSSGNTEYVSLLPKEVLEKHLPLRPHKAAWRIMSGHKEEHPLVPVKLSIEA